MGLTLALAAVAALQGGQTVEKKTPSFEEMIRMRVVLSVPGMDAVSARRDLVYKNPALAKGANLDLLNHPEGRHGFDILDDDARSKQIIRHTIEFLREHLAP